MIPEGTFRTLRFRLTFWNTAVLLLVAGLTLVSVRQALQWTLLRELDHLLDEDALEVALLLRSEYPGQDAIREALERKARSHREDGWFVQVFGQDGIPYISSENPPPLGNLPENGPGEREYSQGQWRVAVRRVDQPGLPPMTLRVGASLSALEEDVARLTRLLLLAGLLIGGVTPALGYFLAGRATRPLSAILSTTRRLRPDRLGERLPLSGTGDELEQLSGTINSFLDRLAQHLKQQREFVANAAHELRSPLAALRASVDVALERERTGQEYRDLLGDLSEECAALGTLINQLLLLAESDSGQLPVADAPVGLHRLAERSVEMFRGVAEQRELALEVEALEPVEVRGSATHLRQVIHNLLDNAIKFTPEGGRVTLAVRRDRGAGEGSGRAVLVVSDNGRGIPPEHLPHVFERFFRGDSARARGGAAAGTGLGLCICQSIVRAYQGEIAVESRAGGGTTVKVTLPACPPTSD